MRGQAEAMIQPESNGQKRLPALILLLFSAVLFMLVKNVTSANDVTFEQVEYWLVGLLPVLFWLRFPQRTLRVRLGLSGALAWLLGLLGFLAADTSYASEVLPFDWRLYLRDNPLLQDVVLCAIIAVLAGAISLVVLALTRHGPPHGRRTFLPDLLIVSLLNFVALFVLLFAV